jgi:hypothetical protein
MTRDELTDGTRIGQLLASEIHGHERGVVGELAVVDADTEVEPTADGAFAYGLVDNATDGDRLAAAYVHPDRLRVEFEAGVETALSAAKQAELRARPKATEPPRTIVFVENGAEVKSALGVVRAVVEERLDSAD